MVGRYGFVVLLAAFLVWFGIGAGRALIAYGRLKEKISAEVISWEVKTAEKGAFQLASSLAYAYKGQNYLATSLLARKYPNRFACENAKAREKIGVREVWIYPREPDQVFLEKELPLKKTLSAIVVFALFLYFLFLVRFIKYTHA